MVMEETVIEDGRVDLTIHADHVHHNGARRAYGQGSAGLMPLNIDALALCMAFQSDDPQNEVTLQALSPNPTPKHARLSAQAYEGQIWSPVGAQEAQLHKLLRSQPAELAVRSMVRSGSACLAAAEELRTPHSDHH